MRIESNQNNSSSPIAPAKTAADHAKALEAAKAFETLFASMMMKSMRNATSQLENDFIPNSMGQKIYTEMLDDKYSELLSKHGSLGLAEMILKQIDKQDDPASALAMLKGLKNNDAWQHGNAFIPSANYTSTQNTTASLTQWNNYITEAGEKFDVDPTLIKAVITQESSGNPSAVSPKGAKGLMQLMDSTAQDMGVTRVFDPKQNIIGGTRYLRELLDKYNGDQTLALASYNAGPAAVDKYNGVPPYPETQNYVEKVSAMQKQLQNIATIPIKEQSHE